MESNNSALYRANAAVSARDAQLSQPAVVFYQVEKKFVDNDYSIPEQSKEVMYYALSVGHHTGVIDCFAERVRCPLTVYKRALALFASYEQARYKLEGIERTGEIQIDKSHVSMLLPAVRAVCQGLEGGEGVGADGAAADGAAADGAAADGATTSGDGGDGAGSGAEAPGTEAPGAPAGVVEAADEAQFLEAFHTILERLAFDGAAYIMGRMREA